MSEFQYVRVRWTCALCGNPIDNDAQVASIHITRKGGAGTSVNIHALCLKPHLNKAGFADMVDDAATVDEQQQIWAKAASQVPYAQGTGDTEP